MVSINRVYQTAFMAVILLLLFSGADAQKKTHGLSADARNVMWESVNVKKQDLYFGPGGAAMQPDLSRITFLSAEKNGYSQKYKIKDGAGNKWVAKIGREAQSETAAVRLMAALGYKSEINYLVPQLTIPGVGTFKNVRLEARPSDIDRKGIWKWGDNPFEKTREYQGLKIMMAFLNNWDMKSANNVILKTPTERQYVISDLGATFGKTGSNSLPLFWRIGRSRNNPQDYSKTRFVRGTSGNHVKLVFNGKNRTRMGDITLTDARWLADLLTQLSDKQIRDAFRAANYSQTDVDLLTHAVKSRIAQLSWASTHYKSAR